MITIVFKPPTQIIWVNNLTITPYPVKSLLEKAGLHFIMPHGATPNFTALAYQKVAILQFKFNPIFFVKIHLVQIFSIKSKPLYIEIGQVRIATFTGLLLSVQHLS